MAYIPHDEILRLLIKMHEDTIHLHLVRHEVGCDVVARLGRAHDPCHTSMNMLGSIVFDHTAEIDELRHEMLPAFAPEQVV